MDNTGDMGRAMSEARVSRSMNETQKQVVMDALRRAFACESFETADGRDCLLSDQQLEMLFGAISLSVAFGPYQKT